MPLQFDLSQHTIWKWFEKVSLILERTKEGLRWDEEALAALNRGEHILRLARSRLDYIDLNAVVLSDIDLLQSRLVELEAVLEGFTAPPKPEAITSLNNCIDSIVHEISKWILNITLHDMRVARASFDSYVRDVQLIIEELKKKVESVERVVSKNEERVAIIADTITQERQQIVNITTELQVQFSNAQSLRGIEWQEITKQYRDAISVVGSEAANKIVEIENIFQNSQSDRQSQWSEFMDTFTDKVTKESEHIVNSIKSKKIEIEELAGVIGAIGVSAGFRRAGENAKKHTIIWNCITVFSMVCLIGITIWSFLFNGSTSLSWESIAGRVIVAASIAVLAGYAAQQVGKYQRLEQYNTRLAIELAAVGPFLAPLKKEDQDAFLMKLGDQSFGGSSKELEKEDVVATNIASLIINKLDKSHIAEIIGIMKSAFKKES